MTIRHSTGNDRILSVAVDMSPAAIDRRLRELAQLHRFGMKLAKLRERCVIRDADSPSSLDSTR